MNVGAPDTGDTAWLLASTALVLLMTPGLAFFYGGMVRAKSVLNMMMMSLAAIAVVWFLWLVFGFSMVFGDNVFGGWFGDPLQFAGLHGLLGGQYTSAAGGVSIPLVGTVPALVFAAFQAGFAMVTVALISGAVADRMRFVPWVLFAALWSVLVYFPVAHWVFSLDGLTSEHGGWITNRLGAIDFAGGTAVEINAGVAGLVLALVVGKRQGWPRDPMRPHNLPAVMLGAGLLWFGWFGFNAGSAFAADGFAGLAWVNTTTATAAAIAGWLIAERVRDGHATSLGAASGAVAGLVAITPAAGALTPVGSIFLGAIAGVLSALAVGLKFKFGYDDSLDVVGVHLVAGLWGTIGIGFFASETGLFYGGDYKQLVVQIVIALSALIFTGVITTIIAFALKPLGWRVSDEEEATGIDESEHAETAYDFA